MNTAVATVTEAPRRLLLAEMATRYGMEPKAFADTLRATVVPREATNEEFAAFLVVAREYNLNPLTKEIYAFPKKGGGIQPIVSVDGWCNLINSHPQANGVEFDDHLDKDNKLSAITCRIWRKDREKPIVVTEYMIECQRSTEPWKQYPRRMLRHKALIQCARYAFGFAGIVDPDEAERMPDVSPMRVVDDAPPPPARHAAPARRETPHDPVTGEVIDGTEATESGQGQQQSADDFDPEDWLVQLEGALSGIEEGDSEGLREVQDKHLTPYLARVTSKQRTRAQRMLADHALRVSGLSTIDAG